MKYFLVLLLFITVKCYAQYPFEKLPAKRYDSVAFKLVDTKDSTHIAVASYKNYQIKLIENDDTGGAILLYFNHKLLRKTGGFFCNFTYVTFPLYIEDVDNDGKPDFIIETNNGGATGLASSNISTTYFLNNGHHKFKATSYWSFYDKPQKQYQFKDGHYNIISQSLVTYRSHNYWLFDLYNYKNGKFINVSKRYNYPLAIPLLYKETFKVTNKIPRKQLQKFSLKQPALFQRDV